MSTTPTRVSSLTGIEPPLPAPTADTVAFWTGGAAGELLIHRCRACARFAHPPTPVCPGCLSRVIAPTPVSGRGRVATYTVNHYPWHPAFEPPYVIAVVELDEQPGLRLTTRLVGVDPEAVTIGMPVRVVFEQHGEVHIPLFTPTDGDGV
ncbi:DNA-binding protein [Pseudonocardia sp. CNS-139]|nr:DNA-binding protein [Pseudonocardia sp. CNS-139]